MKEDVGAFPTSSMVAIRDTEYKSKAKIIGCSDNSDSDYSAYSDSGCCSGSACSDSDCSAYSDSACSDFGYCSAYSAPFLRRSTSTSP